MEVQEVFWVISLACLIMQSGFILVSGQQSLGLNSSVEESALFDLRFSLGIRANYWPRRVNPCVHWQGVQCKNGRVTGINLSGLKRTRAGLSNEKFTVDSLMNFTLLSSFNSSGFALPGSIPEWFGHNLFRLHVLDLSFSRITGTIPVSIGSLRSLRILSLSSNSIAGAIPATLVNLSRLTVLDLSFNSLTGSLPPMLLSIGNLTRLDLSSNYLYGSIPPPAGDLSGLQYLNFSNNSLTSSIPVQLASLSQLVEVDFGNNDLEGELPDNMFESLSQLQLLVLSGNRFDGALPAVLWSMPDLRFLDVSGNNFTGNLPNLSSHVNTSAVFNLSDNLLYGNLVNQLDKFSVIDLSGNYFQGMVPGDTPNTASISSNCLQSKEQQRSVEDCRSFYAERNLSFDNFGVLVPLPDPSADSGSKRNRKLVFTLVGVFGGLGFILLLVIVLLVIMRTCDKGTGNQRGTANVGPVSDEVITAPKEYNSPSGVGESFTYEQLVQSTGNFSETNLIKHGHSGDLFRGILESGTLVVIKRVHTIRKESYLSEFEVFGKVSHTRLVPFLGYAFDNESEKLLVYKYMPNGDLSGSWYRRSSTEDDNLQSLDWITRLKIATGVAEGLCHLHHECNPPLVHRDVQASSILLDDKFEVRLGSLSEACTQEGDHQSVIARLLRKPQTSDQGPSGSSTAHCAHDILCFGKVLLELVTGKIGISNSDEATAKEWLDHTLPYISIYDKELVTKIVDPSLIYDEDLFEEVWAMSIVARSCLNPKASKRPSMKHVLKALENPLKVARQDQFSSARLRTTSSRRSWTSAFLGSWRQNSLESGNIPAQVNKEVTSGGKPVGRGGSSGSGGNELSSSRKRFSNDIFPEPAEIQGLDSL